MKRAWFARTRKTWYELIWRLNYAGRTMEVTRKPYREAMRQANEALELYRPNDIRTIDPRALADKRIAMWEKARK